MSDDWESPAESEFFAIKDHVGSLCIFAVNEFMEDFPTTMGTRDTIKAYIAVVDGPNKNKVYETGLLFGAKLVPQLKGKIGKSVLGTIAKGTAKPGQSAPYLLLDPTDQDRSKATAWVKVNGPVKSKPTTEAPPRPPAYAGVDEEPPY